LFEFAQNGQRFGEGLAFLVGAVFGDGVKGATFFMQSAWGAEEPYAASLSSGLIFGGAMWELLRNP
jgi:hypothetical protein